MGPATAWEDNDSAGGARSGVPLVDFRLLCHMVGIFLVWMGHFFLLYHWLFYKGGGTSGIPLGISVLILAPICYTLGIPLRLIKPRGT